MEINEKGHIIRLFGSGQKANGWFSGIFALESGQTIHVTGVYRQKIDMLMDYDIMAEQVCHPVYGVQYQIKSMAPHVELDRDSLIRYLSSPSFKGIGYKTAVRIVDEFDKNTLDIIASDPQKIKDKCNLTENQINILIKGEASLSVENKLRKLCPSISESLINKIVDCYCDENGAGSDEVMDIVRNNPYRLLYDLSNVTFKDIDSIALSVKFDKYSSERIHECYMHAMFSYVNETHNIYVNTNNKNEYDKFYFMVLDNVGYMDAIPNYQFPNGKQYAQQCYDVVNDMFINPQNVNDIVVSYNENNEMLLYRSDIFEQEDGVAGVIAKCLMNKSVFMQDSGCSLNDIYDGIKIYEKKHRIRFDDSQRNGIVSSLLSSVSVINGGPGHGKTSTVDCVLFIWSKYMREKKPVLAAPTGRAVTVLKNATGNEYDVSTAARLITVMNRYRILAETKPSHDNEKAYNDMIEQYTRNIVILDECSMVGIKTAYDFISLFEDCQFIFVGDVNQLPPIEYGQFFRDLCDCNVVMKTELTVNYRAEGKIIIDNAELINNGDFINIDVSDDSQFSFTQAYGDFSDMLLDEYKNYVYDDKGNLDQLKMKSIGIISPIGKGSTGFLELNRRIQDIVNPIDSNAGSSDRGYEISATHMYINEAHKDLKLRVGDIVMQTKNHPDVPCSLVIGKHRQDTMGIYNGDIGVILSYHMSTDGDSLKLLLNDGRIAIIEEDRMDELILAYAVSIHKSQGSEYDKVIISLQNSMLNVPNKEFACRNLIYTAVTRARKSVTIIGDRNCFNACIQNQIPSRNSMLRTRVMNEILKLKGGVC